MALRAFQTNPSIGGFGSESLFGQLPGPGQFAPSQSRNGCDRPDAAGRNDGDAASRTARPLSQTGSDLAKNSGGTFGAGSCDAFAQIVKELVDNAVDACAHAESEKSIHSTAEQGENMIMKRVRVAITSVKVPVTISSAEVPVQQYANGEGPGTSANEDRETMDCLRIEISDNGCGMDDIDECVTAFHSDKNGTRTKGNSRASSQKTGEGPEEDPKSTSSKIVGDKKQKHLQKQISSDGSEKYTSGRYGVGLTLCLLHAQRLCPGTGACITSATASANEWTRATYEPDTSADNIVCKKKDRFPKDFAGECGTTISLLVPVSCIILSTQSYEFVLNQHFITSGRRKCAKGVATTCRVFRTISTQHRSSVQPRGQSTYFAVNAIVCSTSLRGGNTNQTEEEGEDSPRHVGERDQ